MADERIFSATELEEMGKRTTDLIDEAIDADRSEIAKRLNHRMYAEFLSMHDFFRDWVTGLLSYIYENYGEKALDESLKQSLAARFRGMVQAYEDADFRTKVNMLCMGLRGHLQPLEIKEDNEKVCIKMTPCGTGERLVDEGAYGPPKNFSTIKEPSFITYGKQNCPIYCAHEPILELLPIEWVDHPVWVVYPSESKWGGCRFCIYKKTEYIPEEAYERIGKEKKPSA